MRRVWPLSLVVAMSATACASPSTTPSSTVEVKVYFANTEMGDPCGEVFPLSRRVAADDPLRGALEALLEGPTVDERTAGYEGWFSEATAGLLRDVDVEGRIAFVSLDASLPTIIPNASSSCGSFGLLAQLDATVTAFGGVDEGWYSLDGDRAAFYGWLQLVAPDDPGPQPLPTPSPSPTPTDEPSPEPTPEPTPDPTPDPTPSGRDVPSSLVGEEWSSVPTSRRVVALTFDAGANGDGVPSILTTLKEERVPATFFLTGNWVTAYPSWAEVIGRRFPVGNHTMTHPHLPDLSTADVRAQVQDAGDAIAAATGRDTHPWFRFPYGDRDDRTIGLVNDLGFGSIRWSVDTLGWKGTSGGTTVDSVIQKVMDNLHPGQIVLMHVGSHPSDRSTLDADALPELIAGIRAAGYGFVTLDEFLD